MRITPGYARLNAELHKRVPAYGTGGHKWAATVAALVGVLRAGDVLDYGCGKATLGKALGAMVRNYDPALPEFAAEPYPADLVCCLDVLEHVETECLDAVMDHLRALARKALLLDVSCKVGGKRLADGRPAHINVRPAGWWRAEFMALGGRVVELPSPADEIAVLILFGEWA